MSLTDQASQSFSQLMQQTGRQGFMLAMQFGPQAMNTFKDALDHGSETIAAAIRGEPAPAQHEPAAPVRPSEPQSPAAKPPVAPQETTLPQQNPAPPISTPAEVPPSAGLPQQPFEPTTGQPTPATQAHVNPSAPPIQAGGQTPGQMPPLPPAEVAIPAQPAEASTRFQGEVAPDSSSAAPVTATPAPAAVPPMEKTVVENIPHRDIGGQPISEMSPQQLEEFQTQFQSQNIDFSFSQGPMGTELNFFADFGRDLQLALEYTSSNVEPGTYQPENLKQEADAFAEAQVQPMDNRDLALEHLQMAQSMGQGPSL